MRIGACYYPEHWEPARWEVDAQMMRQAGFNLIRAGEFAWVQCEPSPGQFDWQWLDRALDIFAQQGIDVLLGTPTAAPPAWLMREHPEIAPTRADGRRVHFGGRRHYCPNQPAFREATARFVHAMGAHYAANPHVIGWQIDNEYGGAFHGGHCFCQHCERGFQEWLQRRYQTIDALNVAWGMDFWSMRVSTWEEIPAPRETGGPHNPSLLLAWRRYYTDLWCDYQTFQSELLRNAGVTTPLTTNLTGLSWGFDPHEMGKRLDVVAWDNYPICANDDHGYATPALACDFMRAVNRGKAYWVTEQQSGAGGQGTIYGRTEPGQMRMWAYQALAHGADTLLFFRWRSCPFGAEQYWHGILQHDGRPNWRLQEATKLAGELHNLPAEIFSATTPAQVGVFLSAQQAWSHEIQGHAKGFLYQEEVIRPYKALRRAALDVDTLYEGSDLSPYRLIVLPACQLMTPDLAERLTAFVHAGGTLVVTFRSAVKNWEGVIFTEPLPGLLRQLLGITIDDTDALGADNVSVKVSGNHPRYGEINTSGSLWADVLTVDTAEVIASFADSWYASHAAITRQQYGAGSAWYLATQFDEACWQWLITVLLAESGLESDISVSAGVECTRRQGEQCYIFIANTLATDGWVELCRSYRDLLTQTIHQACKMKLEPFSVLVLVAVG